MQSVKVEVVGDIKASPKAFGGGTLKNASPFVAYRGEARSRLECGLEVLYMSPLWVERHMHDQIRVIGSQWVWVRSCRHFHWERV